MILRNLRLILLLVVLAITQFIVNDFTIFYIDVIGVVSVSLLLEGKSNWGKLMLISIFADLIGHWYLGTHLLAIVILSFFSGNFNRYYQLCGWLNRSFIVVIYFLVMNLIVYGIDLAIGKTFFTIPNLLLEVFVVVPIVQIWLKLITPESTEFIWYD